MEKISDLLGISGRKAVVYPGVRSKEVKLADLLSFKEQYSLTEKSPVVSFVGPLIWKAKALGVARLIQALKILRKDYPNLALVIAGNGYYRGQLEQIASNLQLSEYVKFCGTVEDPSIPIAACDVYAHISFQEGVPLSLLDAMAMGKPVVATKVGGIPEMIVNGENGILVEGEIEEIANTISRLYEDKELAGKLAKNAKKTALQQYSWNKTAKDFLRVYSGDDL